MTHQPMAEKDGGYHFGLNSKNKHIKLIETYMSQCRHRQFYLGYQSGYG